MALLVVAALSFWAGQVTMRPVDVAEQAPTDESEVEVVEQQLGRVITLTTTVTRPSTPLAVNTLAGTITQAAQDGEFGVGDRLYTVGETPVVLVQGDVPFWRELTEGVEGDDVAQVQDLVAPADSELEADGQWEARTTEAVKAWQQEQGYPVTGTFPLGSLIASPTAPVNLAIDSALVRPGATLSGGEGVVSVPDGDPIFAMEVTQQQAQTLPPGTEVRVQGSESTWDGVIADSEVSADGLILLTVTSPEGGLLCGDECQQLPAADSTTLLTQVALVPPVTGPVVPLAAVSTEPDGSATVGVVTDGVVQARQVEVLTVADGLAVVDGVQAGERVRVFSDGGAPAPPGPVTPNPPTDRESSTTSP